MRFETTLNRPVSFSGIGLHSGVPVNMTSLSRPCRPRASFSSAPTLTIFAYRPASKHVARVSYATSLMRQGVLISTTEHLLSVLYSMGIDNAFIQIDNLEVPILDGSGVPFIKADSAGWHPQPTAAAGNIFAFAGPFRWRPPASASRFFLPIASCSRAISSSTILWSDVKRSRWKSLRSATRRTSPRPGRSASLGNWTRCATWV